VFDRWPVRVEAVQEVGEIGGGELPFERLGCLVVACFEGGEVFHDDIEVVKIIGRATFR
jgi:hypothetical protein